MDAPSLGAPLPDFQPWALPALQHLSFYFDQQDAALPASWGSPDVLPALRDLSVQLRSVPALPAAWARGFRQLASLTISCFARVDPPCGPAAPAGAPGEPPLELPPAWAQGFPVLLRLSLSVGATGAVPEAWTGGFPRLLSL